MDNLNIVFLFFRQNLLKQNKVIYKLNKDKQIKFHFYIYTQCLFYTQLKFYDKVR